MKIIHFNDLEGQYCNRNCISCSVFFRTRRFYCEKYLQKLQPLFLLFIYRVFTQSSKHRADGSTFYGN